MTSRHPAATPPSLPHAACYRRRLQEGPLRSWLWAIAQNLPLAGLVPQLYYAFSRRTISPMLWGSAGLLIGLAMTGVPYLARARPAQAIDCLALLDPTPHRELEAEIDQCLRLALPAAVTSPGFSWPFVSLITVTSTLGTRFGQRRAAQDARRRLEQSCLWLGCHPIAGPEHNQPPLRHQ
jgi:hypothetical protein